MALDRFHLKRVAPRIGNGLVLRRMSPVRDMQSARDRLFAFTWQKLQDSERGLGLKIVVLIRTSGDRRIFSHLALVLFSEIVLKAIRFQFTAVSKRKDRVSRTTVRKYGTTAAKLERCHRWLIASAWPP
jgi:hypothetical protein